MYQIDEYYDDIAPSYDDLYGDLLSRGENEFVRKELDRIVKASDRIIDLGCGTGLGRELIAEKEVDYYGIDISPAMIAVAHRKLGDSRTTFEVGNMADLRSCASSSVDVVMSLFGSFSHLLDPCDCVREIRRVCKSGAAIYIMVYSRFSLKNLFSCYQHRTLTPIGRMHPYNIRNSDENSPGANALFYTSKALGTVFSEFRDIKIYGLNGLFELWSFKSSIGAMLCCEKSAGKLLHKESQLIPSNLCHSLILQGKV